MYVSMGLKAGQRIAAYALGGRVRQYDARLLLKAQQLVIQLVVLLVAYLWRIQYIVRLGIFVELIHKLPYALLHSRIFPSDEIIFCYYSTGFMGAYAAAKRFTPAAPKSIDTSMELPEPDISITVPTPNLSCCTF